MSNKGRGAVTIVSDDHALDEKSGFCTKCGNHAEMIRMDDMRCVYSDNTVAISHKRWHARHRVEDNRSLELAKTLDVLIHQLREMERKGKEAMAEQKAKQVEPDNAS